MARIAKADGRRQKVAHELIAVYELREKLRPLQDFMRNWVAQAVLEAQIAEHWKTQYGE